ncbi:MAG: efflux RND transporter periplasmic adaptor subunit [Burkholderiales bacterium]|nr:efflux RND transporter periplasmic adaptor subunit [Burkholderiales bacterium]
MPRPARALAALAAPAVAAVLAACSPPQQGGGFHGFPPAEVTTIKLEPKSLPATYEYVGQTTGSKEVEVRARVTGILEKKLFQEGAPVKAGQVLFVIDPRQMAAQTAALEADVARAQAQKAQAEREVARLKPLAERRAVGQKEADDAISNLEMYTAALRAADAKLAEMKLNLSYTNVTAPISGLSSRAPKSEGSLVNANETLLTTISQVDPMWIPFAISENEQLLLNRAVKEGRLTLPKDNAFEVVVRLSDGTTLARRGRINFADTRVNPSTGTYEMRAEVPNADQVLKPGQFVRVKLAGAVRNNALAVPQVAVLDGAQGKFVYVVERDKDGKDVAGVRPVTLGEWVAQDGANLWVVETGLKPGDVVIVDGVAKLRPGAPVKVGGVAPAAVPPAPGGAPAPAPAQDAKSAPKA